MEDYEIIKRLGGGSFADVFQAKEKATGEIVAIKKLKKKYRRFEDCVELREVKSLQHLQKDSLIEQKGSSNIIRLKQVLFEKKTGTLDLVFEYMETDLYELMKSRAPRKLSEDEIKDIVYQTLLGLFHMHKYGYFHRDMKPENLLLTGKKVKIADFGLAREIRSIPPYTEYVSTRYYRAPECILRSKNYNSPIDIWALGCIMAEMYMHPMPLFYGANEKEVFLKICSILGSPTSSTWPGGVKQAQLIGMKYPNNSGVNLAEIVKGASPDAIDLMEKMLKWDPNLRATAPVLLKHPFFNGCGTDNKKVTSSNFFGDFGDIKSFANKTNRRGKNDNKGKSDNKDTFSDMFNDTAGFNKFLSDLKSEEKKDEKQYEKEKNKYSDNINSILEDTFYNKGLENKKKKKMISEDYNDLDDNSFEKDKKETKKNESNNDLDFLLGIRKEKETKNNDKFDELFNDINKEKNKKSDFDFNFDLDSKKSTNIFEDKNNNLIPQPSNFYRNNNYSLSKRAMNQKDYFKNSNNSKEKAINKQDDFSSKNQLNHFNTDIKNSYSGELNNYNSGSQLNLISSSRRGGGANDLGSLGHFRTENKVNRPFKENLASLDYKWNKPDNFLFKREDKQPVLLKDEFKIKNNDFMSNFNKNFDSKNNMNIGNFGFRKRENNSNLFQNNNYGSLNNPFGAKENLFNFGSRRAHSFNKELNNNIFKWP